jgi:hypothetical protein
MLNTKKQGFKNLVEDDNQPISDFKGLVNYKHIQVNEFTDYSRFLLDLTFLKVKGKETFSHQEFKSFAKSKNLALKKRDAFLAQKYDRKVIDDYLIKSYAIGLLEYNHMPLEVRVKQIAKVGVEYKDSVYYKKRTYDKVVGTYYINSKALNIFPHMDLYRVRVINYLRKILKESFALKTDSDINYGLDVNETRYKVIELIFSSIPNYYTDEKPEIIFLYAQLLNYFDKKRIYRYTDRSKNRSLKYKQEKEEFLGTYQEFVDFLNYSNHTSKDRSLLLKFFNENEKMIRLKYNYPKNTDKKTVYKKFKRDMTRLIMDTDLSDKDLKYLEKFLKD